MSRQEDGTKQPDAIKLLTDDHRQVKSLFEQFKRSCETDSDPFEKEAIALEICAALTVHAQIEEEIFYPAARQVLEEQDLMDEADVEHASAKELIAQIEGMRPDDSHYDAKVIVLGEYIDHHVKEEQEEMFPKVKKAGLDVKSVGAQLAERKAELQKEKGFAGEESTV